LITIDSKLTATSVEMSEHFLRFVDSAVNLKTVDDLGVAWCVLPCCCFACLQGDSSEGPRQVGGAALTPRSIAAAIQVPSPWMDNGTEQRPAPASAFLRHA
jgi:hypothetical protein